MVDDTSVIRRPTPKAKLSELIVPKPAPSSTLGEVDRHERQDSVKRKRGRPKSRPLVDSSDGHARPMFRCPKCRKRLILLHRLKWHMKFKHHENDAYKEFSTGCTLCGRMFKLKSELEGHLKEQ